MAAVHWDTKNLSPSFLHSPTLDGSTESYISTSSLEYLNSQLVAHGYAPSPGLSLDGLSGTDSDRVVKCLLGMLSQRMVDMSRTEELSTKFRTLTYDHERLLTMHRTANEKLANAEREVNLHKTKLTAAQRQLQSAEHAHKQTSSELQRTRTALQGIRATHHQELKRKERELDRITDKWNKLSDLQTKLSTVPAGLKCANVAVVHGSELPRNPSLLGAALDDSEKAREQFADEVARLRRLVVKVVNQVQALLYQVRAYMSDSKDEEPVIYSITDLFPMHPQTHAHDTLCTILNALKDTLAALPQHIASSPAPTQPLTNLTPASTSTSTSSKPTNEKPNPEETARLQSTIAQLKDEIKHLHKQAEEQTTQTQAVIDNFVASQEKTSANIAEMSMELMTAPAADAERERLDQIRQVLDVERAKFTQATIKLGKDRAVLEADRNKLVDEKRSWKVQQMLTDLPPTPDPQPLVQAHAQPKQHRTQPHKSPRKPKQIHPSPSNRSPRKASHHKRQSSTSSSATRKSTRVVRRPSQGTPGQPTSTSTGATTTTIPAYETEVIVTPESPGSPEDEPPQQQQQQQQHRRQQQQHSLPPPPITAPSFSLKPPPASILPSSFVLPPPSPHASLPRKPLLPPSSSSSTQPIPQPDFLMVHLPPPLPHDESTPFPQPRKPAPAPAPAPAPREEAEMNLAMAMNVNVYEEDEDMDMEYVKTPAKRPYPIAKPLAQRMVHAYSPARPSPLSRILMLNSPDSLDSSSFEGNSSTIDGLPRPGLGVVREEGEEVSVAAIEDLQVDGDLFPPETPLPYQQDEQRGKGKQRMSLAAELGVESPPEVIMAVEDEPPLKKRKTAMGNEHGRSSTTAARGGPNNKPSSSTAARREASAPGGVGTRKASSSSSTINVEKENGGTSRTGAATKDRVQKQTASSTARTMTNGSARGTAPTTRSTTTAARGKPALKSTGAGGGPRRVPKNSVEAPDIGHRKS